MKAYLRPMWFHPTAEEINMSYPHSIAESPGFHTSSLAKSTAGSRVPVQIMKKCPITESLMSTIKPKPDIQISVYLLLLYPTLDCNVLGVGIFSGSQKPPRLVLIFCWNSKIMYKKVDHRPEESDLRTYVCWHTLWNPIKQRPKAYPSP